MTRVSELSTLTVIRFLAAIAVVFFHYGRFVPMPGWLSNVVMSGYVWVTFFFMLSGFILVYAARDVATPEGRHDFYVRRLARIVPVYLVAWTLFAACQFIDPQISPLFFLKTMAVFGGLGLVFMQGWVPGAAQYWNTPGWSLSCEVFFYACFPLLFVLAAKMQRRSLWIAAIALTVTSAATVIAIAALSATPLLSGTAFATTWGIFLGNHPVVQITVFLIGIVLGRFYVRGGRLPQPKLWLCVSIMAILALSLLPYRDVRRDILMVPTFATLIYSLACLPNLIQGKWVASGVLLGNASYAMYILQEPSWYLYCMATGTPRWGGIITVSSLITFVVILVVSSVLIYQYFERWAESSIKARFGRRPAAKKVIAGAA